MNDLDQLNQYMAQSSDAPAPNPNHAPVEPIVEALEAYKDAIVQLTKATDAPMDGGGWFVKFEQATYRKQFVAVDLADLILDAYERGATLDWNS